MTFLAIVAACNVGWILARRCAAVMTRKAASKHLAVINQGSGSPPCRTVTVLADVRGLHVGGVLAGGVDAVVTTETAACDVGVIKYRGLPRACLVTVVALVAGDDVVRRLSDRNNIVMTREAASGHGSVIHECDRAPRTCRVAIAADFRTLDVIRVFACCLHRAYRGMAANAVSARALELSARMTPFTRDIDMGAVEIETSAEVIERLLAE